ncbi:hypothetical protein [Pseudoduganella sp. GCM10020061]|uniref:hypothetical protein n=1 Tax=Pseudoduganella sp. GCM10020061 TaxID=3317345 RepID=UPI003641EE84
MRAIPAMMLALGSALGSAAVQAAPLTPNSGPLAVSGELAEGGSAIGRFDVQALLKDGNFTGAATVTVDGSSVSGPLLANRSYLENGRCYFRVENGRARAEISGRCDSAGLEGRFETFIPGLGLKTGISRAAFTLAGGESATAPAASGKLPGGKLTCAFNEPKVSFKWGEPTQYSLQYSNMVSLTLDAGGTYAAGSGKGGRYTRQGGKIRLESGPWAGAIGSLENDRSGTPAVVFHIEENRRADGVHLVDPYTTRCTRAR